MMLMIIFRDKELINIIDSMIANKWNLIKMAFLGAIILLIYGTFVYTLHYKDDLNSSFDGLNYNASFKLVILTTIKDGLSKDGGINDVLSPSNYSKEN